MDWRIVSALGLIPLRVFSIACSISFNSFWYAWMQLNELASEMLSGSYMHLSRRYESLAAFRSNSEVFVMSEMRFLLFSARKASRSSSDMSMISCGDMNSVRTAEAVAP